MEEQGLVSDRLAKKANAMREHGSSPAANDTDAASSSCWAPPFFVDVAWFGPARGVVPARLRPIVLGLYDTLSRPVPDIDAAGYTAPEMPRGGPYGAALRPGVGIPLLHGRSLADITRDSAAARGSIHVVVVLLDETAFQHDSRDFAQALQNLDARAAKLPRVLLLPVLLHSAWLDIPWNGPVVDMTTAEPDVATTCRTIAVEIAQRALGEDEAGEAKSDERISLFISRTASDSRLAEPAVGRLRAALAADPALSRLFDLRPEPSNHVAEALRRAGRGAVLLALHTDHFADSPRCEEEVLIAKQRSLPVVSLLLLGTEERRSPPYGANMLNLVWHDGSERAVLDQLLRVWLHHRHFRRFGPALANLVGLAVEPLLLSRPPELLDFAQGTIPSDRSTLVLYPDRRCPRSKPASFSALFPASGS